MTLTYFGHSTFQIETNGTTLLFDPFFTDNPHTDVTPDKLDPDVVLLTHAHFDHFADTQAFVEQGNPLVISCFEIVQYVQQNFNHENIHPLNEGGTLDFDWGTLSSVHARHTSSFPDGTYGGVPAGFILETEGRCIYDLGDTAPFAEMEWIGDMYDVDLALMPIGDVFTMGIDGAVDSADMIQPALTVPIHYDTFPPIKVDMDDFIEEMDDAGFDVRVLDAGETMEL